jgi:hypothetical protein
MKKILLLTFISLIIVGCNREENNERKALSHCADIKFISYANSNPKLFIDPSKVIEETKKRDKKIKEWIKINHNEKDLMSIGKLRDKMNDKFDDINYPLHSEILFLFSKARDVTMLNDKTIDWKIEYKKEELTNYEEFHLECWNEYKKDNGYYSKDFIKKYLEWQKQDVSNLNKYHHKVFDDLQVFSKNYQFTTKMWELEKKMMKMVPRN